MASHRYRCPHGCDSVRYPRQPKRGEEEIHRPDGGAAAHTQPRDDEKEISSLRRLSQLRGKAVGG